MADRERVIKGVDICLQRFHCGEYCPYYNEEGCMEQLREDVLALIRQQHERIKELEAAQTARVVALAEIKDGEPYWLSVGKELVTRPVICIHREDDAQKPYITFVWQFGTFSWDSEDYGKRWRCWAPWPTDEQRKAVKWE